MKIGEYFWKVMAIAFVSATASFPVYGGDPLFPTLGNGEPGLCIISESTNEYVIFVDEVATRSWKPGLGLSVDYRHGHIKVLEARNFGTEKLLPGRHPVWNTEPLFPFDEKSAFTCVGDPQNRRGFLPRKTRVFSTNRDGLLVSNSADELARTRYGLMTNQWFLGKIGTKVYFWETRQPNIVYFRNVEERQSANYFELPTADDQIFGVTKALSTNMDVGIFVNRVLGRNEVHMNSLAQPMFVEYSFRDAKYK